MIEGLIGNNIKVERIILDLCTLESLNTFNLNKTEKRSFAIKMLAENITSAEIQLLAKTIISLPRNKLRLRFPMGLFIKEFVPVYQETLARRRKEAGDNHADSFDDSFEERNILKFIYTWFQVNDFKGEEPLEVKRNKALSSYNTIQEEYDDTDNLKQRIREKETLIYQEKVRVIIDKWKNDTENAVYFLGKNSIADRKKIKKNHKKMMEKNNKQDPIMKDFSQKDIRKMYIYISNEQLQEIDEHLELLYNMIDGREQMFIKHSPIEKSLFKILTGRYLKIINYEEIPDPEILKNIQRRMQGK
jgi:hypothetical protein